MLAPIGFDLKIIKDPNFDKPISLLEEEIKMNNGFYEEEYSIYYDKPSEADSYLANSEHVKAINYFLGNDFDEIEANKKGIHIRKTNYNLENVSQGEIFECLENLSKLAEM